MAILDLAVRDFRNISAAELRFSPELNLITGHNGAGKTSLLEAIYFLGRAQSFRTTHPATLIREGADAFVLRGHVRDNRGIGIPVGMQRDRAQLRVRMGGNPVRQLSDLIRFFPFQLFVPDSHQLVEGGPRHRRKYLDWGVFHVEPGFFPAWQRCTRALKQRNAALRGRSGPREVRLWDKELVVAAEAIDELRRRYLEELLPVLESFVVELTGLNGLHWEYRPGWARKIRFAQALEEGFEGDQRQGFTRMGPHRADLTPTLAGQPAQDRISRGQQKQVAIAMMLAQATVYRRRLHRPCIFLIDDLASELDPDHRSKVLNRLRELEAQVFLTAIEPSSLDLGFWEEKALFHVEHGQLQE